MDDRGRPLAARPTMNRPAAPALAAYASEFDRCVACGLCLPHCPTYRKTQSEADSPRGRIQLIGAVAQGKLPASPRFAQHIDLCLSCRSCESVCPNNVGYGRLAEAARAMIAPAPGLGARIMNWALLRRHGIAFAGRALRGAQLLGLRQLARWLPRRVREAEAILPPIPRQFAWKPCYPAANARAEVVLFLGCVGSVLDADVLRAAIFVLNRLDVTVHVPDGQGCCGAMARQRGDSGAADAMVARNRRAFDAHAGLPVIGLASGCSAHLHDHLDRKITDICDFLERLDWSGADVAPLPQTIFVHDPCTLRNVLRQQEAVYRVLRRIPQAEVRPLPGNAQCCGGAGQYMLQQPEMARSLREDKIAACRDSGAALLATSNIGCALHLRAGLQEAGQTVQLAHPVTLLANQLGWRHHAG